MTIKQQYFEAVNQVQEFRGKVDDLLLGYATTFFIDEKKDSEVMLQISNYERSIDNLETMMRGIREKVGKETMRKWRQEYKDGICS
jgi:hypothetical protein